MTALARVKLPLIKDLACQILDRRLSCTHAGDIGAPSTGNAGFVCHPDAPLPWFLIERKTIERFTSMRPPVAAAAPRPAAGYRRTEFWGWRPRPSGRRRSGRG